MYKQYLKSSLSTEEIIHTNKNAPKNKKYCNGICQNYVICDIFKKNSNICNPCLNLINLGIKQIKNNLITIEEFIENPQIVVKKICNICKKNKSISNFEDKRNQCYSCRLEMCKNRANKDFNLVLTYIEENKNNLGNLKKYLELLTKDQLIKIISQFKIGRKSTDTKAIILNNILIFFQNKIDSEKCPDCYDSKKKENFICEEFLQKEEIKIQEKHVSMSDFELNILPNILETLKEPICAINYNKYSRDQIFKIARKFGCHVSTKNDNKESVIIKINNAIIERNKNIKPKNFLLYLSYLDKNVEIFVENNMIDATTLCFYGDKNFSKYKESIRYKKLFENLKKDYEEIENIIIRKYRKSWVCKEIAIDVANWISKDYENQIRNYIEDNF
jgi:hypothetical protein